MYSLAFFAARDVSALCSRHFLQDLAGFPQLMGTVIAAASANVFWLRDCAFAVDFTHELARHAQQFGGLWGRERAQ